MRLTTLISVIPLVSSLVNAGSSSGCGSKPNKDLNKRHQVTLNNSKRTYTYWLPPSYDKDTPTSLILSFHGRGETSKKQADLDLLTDPFFNTGQIIVYPQASKPAGESKATWEIANVTDVDDISFAMGILDELESQFCIDTTRIYATGKSQGGGFTGTLACNSTSASRIAAFAPVSGAFYIADSDCNDPNTVDIPCSPGRSNVPFLEFHGGHDTTISIDGGPRRGMCLPSIEHYIDEWAIRDGLGSSPTIEFNLTEKATVSKYDDAGTVMFVYDGDDIGHDWPCTVKNRDSKNHDDPVATFNATEIILNWFGNFTLG